MPDQDASACRRAGNASHIGRAGLRPPTPSRAVRSPRGPWAAAPPRRSAAARVARPCRRPRRASAVLRSRGLLRSAAAAVAPRSRRYRQVTAHRRRTTPEGFAAIDRS